MHFLIDYLFSITYYKNSKILSISFEEWWSIDCRILLDIIAFIFLISNQQTYDANYLIGLNLCYSINILKVMQINIDICVKQFNNSVNYCN